MEKGGGRTVVRRATFALQVATPCEGGGDSYGRRGGGALVGVPAARAIVCVCLCLESEAVQLNAPVLSRVT